MNHSLEKKRKQILAGCVTLSLVLHTTFLAFLQTHSLWFYSSSTSHSSVSSHLATLLEKQARDKILEQTFQSSESYPRKLTVQLPKPEKEERATLPLHVSIPEPVVTNHSLPPFPIENLLAANDLFPVRSFALPPVEPVDLFSDLPKDLIVPKKEKHPTGLSLFPHVETAGETLATAEVSIPSPPSASIAFSEPLSNSTSIDPEKSITRALPHIGVPNLPQLPSLQDLETTNLSHSFESELVFLPRDDGPGYIFALTLIPRADLKLPKIRQHITFLIDRSNSIQRERLVASKQAVQKALEELYSDDTFNILVFDSKVEKLFPAPMSAAPENFIKASEFLDQIQLGSFFSPADLYRPLLLTLPGPVRDEELYTTVLITDGEGFAKKNTQRTLLQNWTDQNSGRASLYTIAMGSDRHLATLDAISVFNKGKLVYATTNRGLRRKLLKLMKTIRTPVAKNISLKAISRSPNNHVELYPKLSHSPHLFLDHPYVIIGVTDTLDDFILFVQGRMKDQWLNIKKPISFISAKRGGQTLKAEWALQKAYRHYEQYVLDDDSNHLVEAHNLLEPFDLQTAFQ